MSRQGGRYRKFVASATAENAVDAFIDPEDYRVYIDNAEADFRRGLVHQLASRKRDWKRVTVLAGISDTVPRVRLVRDVKHFLR